MTPTPMEALSLQNIGLYESTAIRYDGVPWGETMTVSMSIQNESGARPQDGTVECRSVCSVTVKNGDADFALFISQYRAQFDTKSEIRDSDLSEGSPLADDLNQWLLSYVYPYHRQLIADMHSRMGLPPIPLPFLESSQLQRA